MRTLSDLLTDANSVLDLEASEPTGDELTTRANYANQAIWDASSTGQLSEFKEEYNYGVLGATVPLPSNFREAMRDPKVLDSTGNWQDFELIEVENKYERNVNDRYAYILGNPSSGYNMILNNAITGGTLSIVYQRYPSGLLTLADVCELSDPQFVVRAVEAYVLYSRSDDRFPTAEQRANRALANMMGREMKGTTSGPRKTKMGFSNPLKNLA